MKRRGIARRSHRSQSSWFAWPLLDNLGLESGFNCLLIESLGVYQGKLFGSVGDVLPVLALVCEVECLLAVAFETLNSLPEKQGLWRKVRHPCGNFKIIVDFAKLSASHMSRNR